LVYSQKSGTIETTQNQRNIDREEIMKAILTFARGWNCLAAARSLGRRGIEIVAGDEYRFSPTSFSKYTQASFLYPSPDDDPAGFLDTLEDVIRKYRVEGEEYVLMPFHRETYLIARNRARFEPLIKFAIPTIAQIDQVDDKGTLARLCQQRGLPIPKTAVVDSPDDFRAAAETFPYPAFVKVRRLAAAVGIKQVHSAAEALTIFDEFVKRYNLGPNSYPLLQQAVPGDDYCTTFLFDHGEPRASMTYHNLRTYPVKSGTGVLRETVDAPAMERTGGALLGSLAWHGVAEVDFRWDGQAEPVLIEVNPRFWGGLTQSVASGWDYPYLLYRLAIDGSVAAVDPKNNDPNSIHARTETPIVALLATLTEIAQDDTRMEAMRQAFDELKLQYGPGSRFHALRDFFERLKHGVDVEGRWEHARTLLGDHHNTVSDVLSWNDPLPALGVLYPLAVFMKHGKISTELLVS
jgi:predicted ATP-grasp superfamily ATP-dependent carboligase